MTTVDRHRVVLAVGGAVAVNLVVLGLALVTVGAGGFDPFAVLPVAIATAVGALGGVVVHAVFRRAFGDTADRRFVLAAIFVTLLSLGLLEPASAFDGATTARLGVLGLMHIAAASVVVGALVDWRQDR